VLVSRGVDGIAVSNTTLSRSGVSDSARGRESGGLSGRPLFPPLDGHARPRLSPDAGAHSADRHRRHRLGRDGDCQDRGRCPLLQLYTGLVFEGPGLVARIKQDLVQYAAREMLARIGDATGRRAEDWAARPLEP